MDQNSIDILQSDDLMFVDKEISMQTEDTSIWKILVVYDKSIHAATDIALKEFSFENKKIEIINAYNKAEAKELLKKHADIALILLDVVMKTDASDFELVKFIREDFKNTDVRIILITKQINIAPEYKIIKKYDISDYKDKTELTNIKLLITVYSALKSYRDIKTINKLQLELQAKEDFLNKGQKLAKTGSWEWDIAKDKVHLSEEVHQILGLPLNIESNHRTSLKYVHPDDIVFVKKNFKKVIKDKNKYRIEYRIITAYGDVKYIEEKGDVVVASSGKLISIFGIFKDVTNQKEAEKMKQENEFMQKELYVQMLKEREQTKVSEAKDSFLVLFTHELKTPLNAIINFTKYLLKHVSANTIDEIPLAKREKLLKQIDLSAAKILEDITKILELSKIKSKKLQYKITSFNLNNTINEVIEEHKTLCEDNNTTVSLKYLCNEFYLQNDSYRVKQILSNILSNAIKYGKSTVYVRVEYFDEIYTISIEDNGLGIEDKDKVFELFEQMDENFTTRSNKGTGIGLSFVKHLCHDLSIKYKVQDSAKYSGLNFQLFINQNNS